MQNKKKLILIADDNHENRQVLGSLLTISGYEVGVSSDGPKTLEFVKNKLPDLILLDIVMPGMDGFEVCEKIKSGLLTKHIPIIFLTAKTSTEDIVRGFKVGGVDYVTKPFNAEELIARVDTHIEMKILRGLLPMCSSCKSVRDDQGYWHSIEEYIDSHSDALLSHGLCDGCAEKLYGDEDWFQESKLKKKTTDSGGSQ